MDKCKRDLDLKIIKSKLEKYINKLLIGEVIIVK
jgi:hypothetical protein